jgi:hypothetical protein
MFCSTFTATCAIVQSNAWPAPFATTLAGNIVATSHLLAETFTLRALFETVLLCILLKGISAIFSIILKLGKLFTSLVFVSVKAAFRAVNTFAERASKLLLLLVIEVEAVSASRFRTPLNRIFLIYVLVEHEFLPLIENLLRNTCLDVFVAELLVTGGVWTRQV